MRMTISSIRGSSRLDPMCKVDAHVGLQITTQEARRAAQSGQLVVTDELPEVVPVERIALALEASGPSQHLLRHLPALVMSDLAHLAMNGIRVSYDKPRGLLLAVSPAWNAPRQMRPVKMVRYLARQIGRPLRWLEILAEVLGEIEVGGDAVRVEAYLGAAGAVAYDLATDAGIYSCMSDQSGILSIYCSMKGLERTNGVLLFRIRDKIVARSKVSLAVCPRCGSFRLHVDRRYMQDTRLAGKVEQVVLKMVSREEVNLPKCPCGRPLVKRVCSTVLPYEDSFDLKRRVLVGPYCYLPARGELLDASSARAAHELFEQLDRLGVSLESLLSSAGAVVRRPEDCADDLRRILEHYFLNLRDHQVTVVTGAPPEVLTLQQLALSGGGQVEQQLPDDYDLEEGWIDPDDYHILDDMYLPVSDLRVDVKDGGDLLEFVIGSRQGYWYRHLSPSYEGLLLAIGLIDIDEWGSWLERDRTAIRRAYESLLHNTTFNPPSLQDLCREMKGLVVSDDIRAQIALQTMTYYVCHRLAAGH